ncbi:condensation domain-containing protein [Streptomyces crystallinus]|uniref:Condensation domain-containing protein n=1 Tax=Streptomyces crystallinus TaxID=68191 RepID=A0ABP3QB92_9ACTN
MEKIETRAVPFYGRRSVTAPATCAQRHMWDLIRREMPDASFYDFCQEVFLPGKGTVDDVVAVCAELVTRHESLRTKFFSGADGSLVQAVARSGSLEAEIYATGPGEDAQFVYDAWRRRSRDRTFDLRGGPPLRALVVVTGHTPVLAAFCVSHLAADLMSMRTLAAEALSLLAARTARTCGPPPAVTRQPVEQAEFERSPQGRALLARSHAHWRQQLASAPVTMFPGRPDPRGPGRPDRSSAAMDSTAAFLAVRALAGQWRVSTSAVLLTAVGLLLGARSGQPVCALRLLAANRTHPALQHTVANLHQEVLTSFDLRAENVRAVARRAFAAGTVAYANGLFDPDGANELIRAEGLRRGEPLHLSCCFNDIRTDHDPRAMGEAASAEEMRAALARTVVAPCDFEEAETFFLVVVDTDPGWLRFVLCAETAVLPPEEVRAFLRRLERLLVDCAEQPERPWPRLLQGPDPQAGRPLRTAARG